MYNAYVVSLKDVRPHPNADRLQLATCFGNTVCVGLDMKEGDICVFFPTDGQLSVEFCVENHLCRKLPDGTPDTGYLDPDKRNVKTIKLRGVPSEGLVVPIAAFAYTGVNLDSLAVGDTITILNGHPICQKYIPRANPRGANPHSSSKKKSKKDCGEQTPFFAEHIDTPRLCFCQDKFKPGDVICLTEKVHGTSSRNANTLVQKSHTNFLRKMLRLAPKVESTYKYVVGTRRTTVQNSKGGFYGSHAFRLRWGEKFKGKLLPGEEVFGEIAGFTDDGAAIMGVVKNSKIKDKEFTKQYGESTIFAYGCNPAGEDKIYARDDISAYTVTKEVPKSRYFIYRMNYTTPDGTVIEYSWDQTKRRAEEMGFETVPELDRFIYTTQEDFMAHIKKFLDIPSTIDPSHVIEGVVVRALNDPGFRVAKEKSINFQILEGIIKEEAETPDMEEAEEILVEI